MPKPKSGVCVTLSLQAEGRLVQNITPRRTGGNTLGAPPQKRPRLFLSSKPKPAHQNYREKAILQFESREPSTPLLLMD